MPWASTWKRFLVGALLTAGATRTLALPVTELEAGVELRVRRVGIEGHEAYGTWTLSEKLWTRSRPWYAPWRHRPELDPFALEGDLQRLERFYQSEGYWHVRVGHDLEIEGDLVDVLFRIDEGGRARARSVLSSVTDLSPGTELPGDLALVPGEPFTEAAYQESEVLLRRFFLDRGHPNVKVRRQATVDLDDDLVDVEYLVTAGPRSRFGETVIQGTQSVSPEIVRREIRYVEGELFRLEPIDGTRSHLLDLELFRAVRIGWQPDPNAPDLSRVAIDVEEKPPRRLKVGAGYGTADELRGELEWKHFNWLGGGRQLSSGLKVSTVTRSAHATFVQPHFGTRGTRGILEFRQGQEDEDTFTLLSTALAPRIEHAFSPALSASLRYRILFAKLSDVDGKTSSAIGGVKREGILSGSTLAFVHDTTENPFDPREGHVLTLSASMAGEVLGGGFDFYKLAGEAKQYLEVGFETVLALRVGVGLAEPLGDAESFPIFERLYAGGERSVRGYGRRRLGPLSDSDRPLGGLSRVEGSVELRRAIWGPVGGAVFLDFGEVSLETFDLPVEDLEFSAGPGFTMTTPIGPVALFVGLPFDPPAGDAAWQIHFSIGQFF